MESLRRLQALWSWLPAFRAVAETQHLPSASEELEVSPSALSRSIRLLEEEVGQPLFDRVGRNIRLNAAGHKLLSAVRDGMRLVDEGLSAVAADRLVGRVHISVPGPFAPIFVLPALSRLAHEHPDLVPVLRSHPLAEAVDRLRRGSIDLAILGDAPDAPDLLTEPLCRLSHGVYCGEDHPMRKDPSPSLEAIGEQGFIAPDTDAGIGSDGWPPHLPRRVILRATQMQVAVEACARGEVLAVLPDVVASRHGLHRLPMDDLPPVTLYLVRRPPLPLGSRAEVVAAAVRAVATAAGEGPVLSAPRPRRR